MNSHKVITCLLLCICCSIQNSFADDQEAFSLIKQASKKMQMGDSGKAEQFYMQALQESPANLEIKISVAEFYIQQARYAEAENIITNADQKNYRVWRAKSILLLSQGKEKESILALEKAFNLGGRDLYILQRLQTHYEMTGNRARQQQIENNLQSHAAQQNRSK